ncbi:MAG: U32 family peptidase [Eubacteriales bacterium]|nr:U32 family peptidase [Eubacteriales bacterium]
MARSVELLSPAGSIEAARAAVNAGADAIYMGGPLFSARAYAESAESDMLTEAIRFCHLRGVKVYMTLNTLLKEREFSGLYEYLLPYYREGLDAVIVQDPGVLGFVKKHFPELPIHASTQMTVTGRYSAALLKELGASRIVTARELSLEEVRDIHAHVDIEIEGFIHGALCYCYSGQCLMSSMIGGRSGNRGRCAGTCRLPYEVYDENGRQLTQKNGKYVLSMKDFNTLPELRAVTEAGICSLKIEGRMKSPLYVAAVTHIYRKYLDAGCPERIAAEDERLLREVFDRGGSTDGYLSHHNGRDMIVLSEKAERRPDGAMLTAIKKRFLETDLRVPVRAEAVFRTGAPAELRLSVSWRGIRESVCVKSVYEDRTVRVEPAQKSPMDKGRLRESLDKFGATPYAADEIGIEADESIFLPVREINELRRKAADELTERILAGSRRDGGTI